MVAGDTLSARIDGVGTLQVQIVRAERAGVTACMQLYNYFRSSASYRVRIALALKGLDYDYVPVHLAQQRAVRAESYAALSPARLVPLLQGRRAHR